MYIVPVTVKTSDIDGKGVFSDAPISKDAKVWLFKPGHDFTMSKQEYDRLSTNKKITLDKTGYFSPWTNLWVFPPEGDPAQYTNHSPKNNLSVVYDEKVSPEPYFVANRDIKANEELTNNYLEFDEITRETKPVWVKS